MIPLLVAGLLSAPAADVPIHPSRLLVKLREGAPPARVAAAHRRLGARVLRDLPQIRWQVVEVAPARLLEARELYRAEPAFERADFDTARKVAYQPNDPYWPGMGHMLMIGADQAWDTEKGSPSVVIGVIDTGLSFTHPDLAGNLWTNPGEVPGNGLDDDGNGYVDDVHGYDFAYDDPDPNDVYGHGTACAGIVAAIQDNGIGVTGVAPLCRVAGIKTAIDSGYLYDSANVPGMLYCADEGFDVISMSFYSDDVTPAERDAIDYCWSHGVVPVAAAGNDARVFPYYPAAYENVIAVAALDSGANKAGFSNWGTWVDVAAPGTSISTVTASGGYTTGFAGTSGACPHVAGLAALLASADPLATNAQVRDALENGAVPTVQAPYGEYTGYGRIWCPASLACLQGPCSTGPARFHFLAPCGGGPIPATTATSGDKRPPHLVYGTHFDVAANVELVTPSLQPLAVARRTRNELEVTGVGNTLPYYLVRLNNGAQTEQVTWSGGSGWHYAPSDAGTSGPGSPVSTGGFRELHADDGVAYTCTARADGKVYVELVVRKVLVPSVDAIELYFERSYSNVNGTETIDLYDWSTWSFPYGTWVSASSVPAPTGAPATLLAVLPSNPARFVDDEGTMYVRITTTGAAGNGVLSADQFRVIVH
jgi:hypothetical protein